MLILSVHVPGEPPRKVRVDRPAITLGRSSTNDVPLADRTLSRVHARIETVDDTPMLIDLESRNGTALNGVRITAPVPLRPGDRITLGETTVELGQESTARVVIDSPDRETPSEHTLFRSSTDLLRLHREASDTRLGKEELARLNASLRILNEISVELLGDIPLSQLLNVVMEKIFSYLEPDRGLIMLADESGELKPEVVKFTPGADPSDIRLSKTLVQAVMEQRNGVLMIDTAMDAKLAAADSIRLSGVTSCLAAPLFVEEKVIGLIYLEARLGRRTFTEDDLKLLTPLANTVAIKIQNLRLQVVAAAKQRIDIQMALAWDIQRRLLPDHAPNLPHTTLHGRTIPSLTVSGDYYDFFERPDKTVDVVVADVCGKGMGASILAASVQSAFEAWAAEIFPPDKLCARLNDLIWRRTNPEKFVTFFSALYDPESGSVVYTNAGHNPGILVRADGQTELLGSHGLPLGLFPGRPYGSSGFTLHPGDLLMLYTDGVTEANDPSGEEFGLQRLTSAIVASRHKPLEELEVDLAASLASFVCGTPYGDDRTIVFLRRN